MNNKKSSSATRTLVKVTLSEQTYEALKSRILDQELAPGSRLNIDALSKELGVSSSPVRESLARLEAERLIVSELYSGYSVAPQPTISYLHSLLDFRILIEGHCGRIGADEKSPDTLATLEQLVEQMAKTKQLGTRYHEYRKFIQADAQFHQAIVDSAHNEVISDVYSSKHAILLQSRLYLNREGGTTSSETVLGEHRAILKAYRTGNGKAAEAALRQHLEQGRKRLLVAASL